MEKECTCHYSLTNCEVHNAVEKAKRETIYVYDGVNGDILDFDDIKEAQEFIVENFCDPKEGIHPDIDLVLILKQVAKVCVEEAEGGLYDVKFKQL